MAAVMEALRPGDTLIVWRLDRCCTWSRRSLNSKREAWRSNH
ncbi:hypothetical protein R4P65_15250 [Rhodococcus sp. IEGM 1318]|nr:hypothetical protein [Rhodococcus sp. IEGM 1318]MDV8006210.1 hypothetical protein [Rhodococcus sp. IEGM 1318]